ncbi:MAG TPA: DUF1109 domain-containing protein [Caulobacteraceae bacterium]|jgi:hypothetical protein
MKTSELIAALAAADTKPVRRMRPLTLVAPSAGVGLTLALAVLAAWLGFQPLASAVGASWFWMKAGYSLALALAGFLLLVRVARPGAPLGPAWILVAGLALAAIWMMAARASMRAPVQSQPHLWLGDTWKVCPWRILALAGPIFLVIVLGLRRLAPTRLALTGGAAGLLAGGLAAAVYGLYCQESSAPFVAVWYSAGIAVCALMGAWLGPRFLRW